MDAFLSLAGPVIVKLLGPGDRPQRPTLGKALRGGVWSRPQTGAMATEHTIYLGDATVSRVLEWSGPLKTVAEIDPRSCPMPRRQVNQRRPCPARTRPN